MRSVRYVSAAIASVAFSVAGGVAGAEPFQVVANVGPWQVVERDDRFDGKMVFIRRFANDGTSSIIMSVSAPCDHCAPSDRISLSFVPAAPFSCPYHTSEDDYPRDADVAYVKWQVDDGPVFSQRYEVKGHLLPYNWHVEETRPGTALSHLKTLIDVYGVIPSLEDHQRNFHVLPSDDFVQMLASGHTLYLRGVDRCGSKDITFELEGLTEALTSSEWQEAVSQ
jgi:hypothetical protein